MENSTIINLQITIEITLLLQFIECQITILNLGFDIDFDPLLEYSKC
jgi:hypothetical protein